MPKSHITVFETVIKIYLLAITRLGPALILLHCIPAAVYPLIAAWSYLRMGILLVLYLAGSNVRAIGLHCFVVRQNVALGLLIQHVDIVVSQVDDPHPAAGRVNDYRGG